MNIGNKTRIERERLARETKERVTGNYLKKQNEI